MEGVITCAIALFSYVFIVRFPDEEVDKPSFRFLKPDESKYIVDTLEKDRADVEVEPFSLARFLKPAREIEIWGFAMIFFCITTVTYSFAFFLPIILRDNLGYSVAASQCLVAPPYVLAAMLMYATSWWGDKYQTRAPVIIFNSLIAIIGLPVMGFAKSSGAQYFGAFIGIAGANANVPATMAYQANNIRGQWKRAFCSATLTGLGGVGGIAGSLVFRSQDAPGYMPGFTACIV
jgi:MFS family permease